MLVLGYNNKTVQKKGFLSKKEKTSSFASLYLLTALNIRAKIKSNMANERHSYYCCYPGHINNSNSSLSISNMFQDNGYSLSSIVNAGSNILALLCATIILSLIFLALASFTGIEGVSQAQ